MSINKKEITKEMIKKAMQCKTAEELIRRYYLCRLTKKKSQKK